jgi:hypothetical protein
MDVESPLQKAARIAGTPTALAKKIGRRQSTMWEWMQRGWPAPDACQAIAEAVDNQVTEDELLKSAADMKKAARAAQQDAAA